MQARPRRYSADPQDRADNARSGARYFKARVTALMRDGLSELENGPPARCFLTAYSSARAASAPCVSRHRM